MKKKLSITVLILMFVAVSLVLTSQAYAGDVIVDSKIESMSVKTDKNGNQYVMFIISEDRTLNGVAYTADVVVMAFGSAVAKATQLSQGERLKAVCSPNEYKGKKNYNVIQIL